MDVTKGYKAFRKGLICESDKEHRKQYQENTDYEEEGGRICNPGMMHYCLTPLDCLQHYNLIDENGDLVEICEVQALATPVTDDSRKYATQKLHIGAKLQMKDWIKASVSIMRESIKENGRSGGDWSKLAGGDWSQLAGGDESKLVGGNESQLAGGDGSILVGDSRSILKGGLGSLLVIAERDTEGNITGHAAGIVDGESIRPDTWYCLKDGKLTEAER